MKQVIITEHAPKPVGPYSQAIKANGFIFCSGQVAINPVNNEIEAGTVTEQTKRILSNIQAVLESQGSSLDSVVKCQVYLADMNDFSEMNTVYSQFFKKDCPARLAVQVGPLFGGLSVEIDAIALA